MSGTVNVNVIPSDITTNSTADITASAGVTTTSTLTASAGVTTTASLTSDLLDKMKLDGSLTSDLLDKVKAQLSLDAAANLKSDLLDKIKATLASDLKSDLLDKIRADASFTGSIKELAPLLLTLLWTEIPMVRVASPHRYRLAFSIFGFEIFAVELHGESKIATAKNPHAGAGDIHV
jgi:hypothetical protein